MREGGSRLADKFIFDELAFFAKVKQRPGMYLGKKSLLSLRDQLFGMTFAFRACGHPDALYYFTAFIETYNKQLLELDGNGYACWWNHLIYTSGNCDNLAFDAFYINFESYLKREYQLTLPTEFSSKAKKENETGRC